MDDSEKKELKKLVEKWMYKKSNLIMILHEIQNHYGYIPKDVSRVLSEMLNISLARIYEVLTFYHYFKLDPPGEHKISVCIGTACYLKGAQDLVKELKEILDVEEGEATEDGLFQLEVVRCLGCCGMAPVITIDGKVYGNLQKKDIAGILAQYSKEGN